MSRFREELKVIPRTARSIAALGYVLVTAMFSLFVQFSPDKDMARTPEAAKIFIMVVPGFLVLVYVLMIGYVYADAKRRGMRYGMWTLLAIFIPYMIGVMLYFILRDPLMRPCPGCAQVLKSGYTFCPHCGTSLLPTCPNCGRGVEPGWANCPQCGTKLPSPAPRTT